MTEETEPKTTELLRKVKELEKILRCNCDLDNWEPEATTGHSWVCRIHQRATGRMNEPFRR